MDVARDATAASIIDIFAEVEEHRSFDETRIDDNVRP
jgi:hypothetical protein